MLHEKNLGLKAMQVKASKSVTRMTKEVSTYELARLVESTYMGYVRDAGCFDLVVAYH